jgi:hypothetical protein
MSNPYQPPQPLPTSPAAVTGNVDREKLRRVARYQQWVIYTLLVNIVLYIVALSTRQAGLLANLAVLVVALGIVVFGVISISLLASELFNTGIGVLCGVLVIVPCISLITLLVVNGKATSFLQKHGIKVGFMGANPDQI